MALFNASRLERAAVIRNPADAEAPQADRIAELVGSVLRWRRAAALVAEHPQALPEARGKRQRDAELAAAVSAALVASHRRAVAVTPSEWTGGVAKAARHVAALDVLTGDELLALRLAGMDVGGYLAALEDGRTPSPWHDVIDAVALGLWHQGRATW